MFKVPKEENYKANMIAKLVSFEMAKMPVNVLVEVAKVLCIECMLFNTIEEKEDWQIPIL